MSTGHANGSSDDVLLVVEGLSKSFPGVQALHEVSFELRRGEVHVLLGENGAGKSTLIKILSGIYRPDRGRIIVDGRPVALTDPHAAQRLGIATIHQENMLVPYLSVAENVFLGRIPRAVGSGGMVVDVREMHRRARNILDRLGVDTDPQARVGHLSTARRKLVEIARALSLNARIVIMDEPTAALSSEEGDRLFAVIGGLRAQGVSVVYISHRLDELHRIGDRVTVLRDGGYVGTVPVAGTSEQQLVRMMVGRTLTEVFPQRSSECGQELLRVEHLTRRGAFTDITLSARAGEIVGVAGLLGSGRTELLHCIFGALPYDSGRISVEGRVVTENSPGRAIKNGVSLLPSDRKGQGLVLMLPVKHNLTLPALARLSRWGVLQLGRENAETRAYVTRLAIRTPSVNALVKYLSGGNQQKVLLARALYSETRILLLDEPTFGVDIGARVEIYRLLDGLTRQGAAVVVVSSDMAELIGLSDRIVVMRQGRMVGELLRPEATQEEILRRAAGGGHGGR